MSESLDLFSYCPPAQYRSPTSVEAAVKVEPRAGTLRRRVLDFLRSVDGATDDEMQVALDMNPSTQRPRRVELVAAGWVRDSGTKRRTRGDCDAVVWTAKGCP